MLVSGSILAFGIVMVGQGFGQYQNSAAAPFIDTEQ